MRAELKEKNNKHGGLLLEVAVAVIIQRNQAEPK